MKKSSGLVITLLIAFVLTKPVLAQQKTDPAVEGKVDALLKQMTLE